MTLALTSSVQLLSDTDKTVSGTAVVIVRVNNGQFNGWSTLIVKLHVLQAVV